MEIIHEELRKLHRGQLLNKRIFLMGRIEHLLIMSRRLREVGYFVAGILDNDRKKQGMIISDLRIQNPENCLCPFDSDIRIIIYSPKYWEDMVAQLAAFGYKENEQVFVLDRPSEAKNRELVKNGYQLYRELLKEYGKNTQVFMANCPLGDYYLLGLFFEQYCKFNKIEQYVMVGESAGIEKLSDLFGIRNRKRLTTSECNALIRAWMFLGEEKVRMKPLTIWQGAFRFNPCLIRQRDGFTFLDTFKSMIYHLPQEIEPAFPLVRMDKTKIKTIFEEQKLQPGKTVLLSPFSYSLQTLPTSFWEQVVRIAQEKGYSVAVNVGEEREKNELPGTVTLQLDFASIMGVMELAGTVIGMRSGFFDITSQAKCKRIVLYPKTVRQNVPWNSTDMQFCSLASMGLCDDAVELEATDEKQLLEKILKNLE